MKDSAKGRRSQKHWLRYSLIIAAVLLGVLFIRQAYVYLCPQSLINFQQYKPTKLPLGMSASYHRLEVLDNGFSLFPYKATISLSQTGGTDRLVIFEGKHTDLKLESGCLTVPASVCAIKYTPKQQAFSHRIDFSGTEVGSESIHFVKGGTDLSIQLSHDVKDKQPVSDAEWSEVIDSFTPTDFSDLQVWRSHPGP